MLTKLLVKNSELLFWISSLIVLYLMPVEQSHFSLCPLNALGFTWCPGCGLGHSIHYYLHIDFEQGWSEHYLGAFALVVIGYRIFQLVNQINHQQKPEYVQ